MTNIYADREDFTPRRWTDHDVYNDLYREIHPTKAVDKKVAHIPYVTDSKDPATYTYVCANGRGFQVSSEVIALFNSWIKGKL